MKRKHLIILLALVAVPASLAALFLNAYGKMSRGYEVDRDEAFHHLSGCLEEEFGFGGFDASWIVASWANGFKDQTWLYQLSMPAGQIDRLRSSFPASDQSRRIGSLEDGRYLGRATAPDWWDAEVLDTSPSWFHDGGEVTMRLNVSETTAYLIIRTG